MAQSRHDFNCPWHHCGKSFHRKSDLCRHYRIHTNERRYHCTVKDCNKRFIQRSALTVHSRVHTGEKPHVCGHEGCQKAFSDSSSLVRHRRIHTGKLPYICQEPGCEQSFCRKTALVRHQHRSHPQGSLTRPSLEDATLEHRYQQQGPVTASIPSGQDHYLLPQQPYYPNFTTPNREFFSPQSVQVDSVPAHKPMSLNVEQNAPVTSLTNMSHAAQLAPQAHLQAHPQAHPQQQMYTQMGHPRHDPNWHINLLPHEYHQAVSPVFFPVNIQVSAREFTIQYST